MGKLHFLTLTLITYLAGAIDFDPLNNAREDVQPSSIVYNITNARYMFRQFVKEFNKQYANDEEYDRRYKIFFNNLIEINEKNKRSQSEVYGITTFADFSEEEIEATNSGLSLNGRRANFDNETIEAAEILTNVEAPEEFDWRREGVVTHIKDQGMCGSCWAFGAVGIVEGQYAIKHSKLLSLSEKELVDCLPRNGGCSGSYPHLALEDLVQLGGLMLESEYPYKPRVDQCAFQKDRAFVKVKKGYTLNVRDEEELKRLLYQKGPLSIGFVASSFFSKYRGRIYQPSDEDCPLDATPNHAVLLVGYGSENGTPYWIIKNSYGTIWGESGYMRLVRGRNACSILHYVSSADVV